MFFLFLLQEIAKIIMYLTLPTILILLYLKDRKDKEEHKSLIRSTANRLIELADDEKPIMLKVDQDKLNEKTVDEIERRGGRGGR